MKKQYLAPKSENVQLDPLMVEFLGAVGMSPTAAEDGTVFE